MGNESGARGTESARRLEPCATVCVNRKSKIDNSKDITAEHAEYPEGCGTNSRVREGDRGCFVVLDPRLATRFGTAFPKGVAIERMGLVEAIETVRKFLERERH